jgi:hypothetical protein
MCDEEVYCCSIDIGKRNFSFLVEKFNKTSLLNLPFIPKNERYNADGTTTTNFGNIIQQVCNNGEIVLYKNSDLTQGCAAGSYLDPQTFHNMTELLNEYKEYWDLCDFFIIERQMAFKGVYNTMALKLGQHCYSYFAIMYGTDREYVDFAAYYKTQVLGAKKIKNITKSGKISYKAMNKPSRKQWSIDKAISILTERKDINNSSMLTSKKKADDLADCLTQSQAWKYLNFVDKIEFFK